MENEGEKAEQMEPELPGKGCEKFPMFQGFFPSVFIGMSGNHPGRASTIVLGLLTPVKNIGNLKLSTPEHKFDFQLLACFKTTLVAL